MRIQNILKLILFTSVTVNAATISRVTTWSDGQILTAANLNTEFNTVFDAVNSLDNTNLSASANIAASKLDPAIADDGLGLTASSNLKVNTDDVGVEKSGDTLQLKDLGVTTAKINDLAVTTGKIALLGVTAATIADATITHGKMAVRSTTAAAGIDPGLGGIAVSTNFVSQSWSGGTADTNSATLVLTITAESRPLLVIFHGSAFGCGDPYISRISGAAASNLGGLTSPFGSNLARTADTGTATNVPITLVGLFYAQAGATTYAVTYRSLPNCAATAGNVSGKMFAVEL